MHFPTLLSLSLTLTTSAIASTSHTSIHARHLHHHHRDVADASKLLNSFMATMQSLDTAVKAYNGGSGADLKAAADQAVASLNAITQSANQMDSLSTSDIMGLEPQANNFEDQASKLLSDTLSKKTLFAQAGICGNLLDSVKQLNTATDSMMTAVIAKVPQEAQSFASPVVQYVDRGFGWLVGNLTSCASTESPATSNTPPQATSAAPMASASPYSSAIQQAPASSSSSSSCTEESSAAISTMATSFATAAAATTTSYSAMTSTSNGTAVATRPVQAAGVGKQMATSHCALALAALFLVI